MIHQGGFWSVVSSLPGISRHMFASPQKKCPHDMVPSGDAKRAEELKPLFWDSNFLFLSEYTMHGHLVLLRGPVTHPMCTTHCLVGAGEPDAAAVPTECWHTPGDPDTAACGVWLWAGRGVETRSVPPPLPGAVSGTLLHKQRTGSWLG